MCALMYRLELTVLKHGMCFSSPSMFVFTTDEHISCITYCYYLAHTTLLFMYLEIVAIEKILYHKCGNW